MDRRLGHALRAGTAAVGVSFGFLALASTAQTPDGFIHASFGGPLDVFGSSSTDVVAIGDGPDDATELAALLKGPAVLNANPDTPYRVAFEAGSTPDTKALNVFPATDPAGAPIAKQALDLASRPVVDSKGRVDCTGAVSCQFDPATKITTVTYADGVIAMVQKINEMTVVAYKTAAENIKTQLQALSPVAPTQAPMPAAAAPAPVPTTAPLLPPPAPEVVAPVIDPGPAVLEDEMPEVVDGRRGPKVSITRPPLDFTPGRDLPIPSLPNGGTSPNVPGLDKVKEALDSVASAVGDAVDKVGKAIGAGAAGKPAS